MESSVRIAVNALSVVLALAFLAIGAMKIINTSVFVEQTSLPSPMVIILGALELAGAIGLIAGFWIRTLGAMAATGLALLLIGAVVFHILHGDLIPNGALPVLLAVVAVITAILQFRVGSRRDTSLTSASR
jgi:uncharacterized membrane protein